jgi:hypothetical protein
MSHHLQHLCIRGGRVSCAAAGDSCAAAGDISGTNKARESRSLSVLFPLGVLYLAIGKISHHWNIVSHDAGDDLRDDDELRHDFFLH